MTAVGGDTRLGSSVAFSFEFGDRPENYDLADIRTLFDGIEFLLRESLVAPIRQRTNAEEASSDRYFGADRATSNEEIDRAINEIRDVARVEVREIAYRSPLYVVVGIVASSSGVMVAATHLLGLWQKAQTLKANSLSHSIRSEVGALIVKELEQREPDPRLLSAAAEVLTAARHIDLKE